MLKEIIDTIKDNDTIWVMENSENSDDIFKEYVTDKLFSNTYVIISKDIAYIFVHKLDEGNIDVLDKKFCKIYVYDSYSKLEEQLIEVLTVLNYPPKMLLSYSTMSDETADIIKYGAYRRVARLFRKLYKLRDKKVKISSSQLNIYELKSKYSQDEIEKISKIACLTDEILRESFYNIKLGMSEKDIAKKTQEIMVKIIEEKKEKLKIVNYDLAWDICPIVIAGENLEKGGHASPSNKTVKRGDTIYYDYGIKATFENGKTYYTDMQRMGYILKENESQAPEIVQKVFDTLFLAVKLGIEKMKPGVKAYKIDEIVRGEILNGGYPDYPHATGHPVGRDVHGAGALISYGYGKRARLKLVENGIYTLEPRININNGGSIEEMILVTKDGGKPLCDVQTKLYLI